MFSTWAGSIPWSPYHFWRILGRTDQAPNSNNEAGEFELELHSNFSSNHPSITLMSFADGSVVAVSDTVDPELFFKLGTKAGKEVATRDGL